MKTPKVVRPINTAPRDGTPIDLWSPTFGWVKDVWFDADDGWITLCPPPFTGWRPTPRSRYADMRAA